MSLIVLFILVVGGISAIAVFLHMLGLSKRRILANPGEARAAWQREFAEDPARRIILSHDHHAALIETASGKNGIVWPIGADATARYLTGATVKKTKSGLQINLRDFTAPYISLTLDPCEIGVWSKVGTPTP